MLLDHVVEMGEGQLLVVGGDVGLKGLSEQRLEGRMEEGGGEGRSGG